MKAWVDGHVIDAADARVSVQDRALRGHGVFETLRCTEGHVFRQDEHLARAVQGAGSLGIEVDPAILREALDAVAEPNATLNIQVSAGPGGIDDAVRPTILAIARPLVPLVAEPVHAVLSGHVHSSDPTATIKALGFTRFLHARQAARAAGAADALLRNEHDRVVEASTSNVMAIMDGRLLAPGPSEGALAGVTRSWIIETLGLPVTEPLTLAALHAADEAWLCNTNGIRSLRSLDGTDIATGPTAPRLQAEYEVALRG